MKTILIIEDDIVFSRSISNWLVKKGMKTECVATLANARKAIGQKEFDLILADLRLPDGNSTSLLKWMNEKYYSIPFLIMTNYGQVENAVTTMQLGAINYLCKPVQPDNLLALITEILDKNDNEQEFYRGESPKAHEMYRLIEMIACADISVLLRGASGTGKDEKMKETKYTVKYTTSFKKDYKRAIKRGLKIELLEQVVALLAMGEPLPDKNRDHDLSGDWAGHRECHILPDWLLVYRIEDDVLMLTLARTGTHSDLFGK